MSEATCVRCGAALPVGARFCPGCGSPVGAPPPEERKIVTVVFADLVGSTELAARLDPERYREVLATYYRTVSEVLESLRGRAYDLAGDAVVGVFGIPHAHDDDAVRAVRAGLELVGRVERISERLGLPVPLRVRVGINTGPVAIGSEGAEHGLLFGATVNLAARLQEAAEPGTVLVGETTWMLTRDQVTFGEPVRVHAKGFEDTATAWPALGLAPRGARRTIPLVDRRRELRLLEDAFESVRETSRAHLVTLLGEPGVGKSRVAEEFLRRLPAEVTVLVGRASPFGEDVAFAPLAQMLLDLVGEEAGAPEEHLRARLRQLVERCCPDDDVPALVERLGIALGLGTPGREEGRYRVGELRAGLHGLLSGLARRGPVVLVLEDAHLAEPGLLDLIEELVRSARRIPLLVLCVARYDLLDTRPGWGGGLGDSLNLYLEPLADPDATELALQAGEGLDREVAESVARHAGGNPFFIVETTGMLRHAGGAGLPASDTGPIPVTLLPPTVQAVVAARIDHLPPAARDLVRKASVFPRATFHVEELSLVAEPGEDLGALLEMLEDEELIVRDEHRPGVYRFRHGIVRDVAYDSLPKRERKRLHLRVASALAEDERTAGRYPRSIAYHLEQAAKAALDLDPNDRELAERAVEALTHAVDLAMWASEAGPAADLYERALALAGPERTWGLSEAVVLANLGEARYWLGDFEGAVGPLRRALELGGDDPRVLAHACRFLGDIELSIHGDRERAAELFDRALAAARELGDPWTLARTMLVAAWAPYWAGEMDRAREMFEEALTVARSNPEGDPWAEARALVMVATVESETGDDRRSLDLAAEALAIAEGSGDRFSIAVAREAVGSALRRLWRLEEALTHLDAAAAAFRELGARWELASALTSRGLARRFAGDLEGALEDLREAYRLCRELKERSLITWTAAGLAKALVAAGDTGAARQILAEAASSARAEGPGTVDWLLDAEAEILLAEGERWEALERALEVLRFERERGNPKDVAAQVWWVARVFGPQAAGGAEEVERARELLERLHAEQLLREPELAPSGERRSRTAPEAPRGG
ncbi:Adenylate cyclase 2 [bacterium HR12]|nr:Adenylate cyclase 2 [bacterium HR12]